MKESIRLSFFDWVWQEGSQIQSPERYLYAFIDFLNQHGFSITRVAVGGSSLHPEVEAIGYQFTTQPIDESSGTVSDQSIIFRQQFHTFENGTIIHNRFNTGIQMSDIFRHSPIPVIWDSRKPMHIAIRDLQEDPYPVIRDLREAGCSDYLAIPLLSFQGLNAFASFATDREGGFSGNMIQDLIGMTEIFALGWHRFRLKDTMQSLLDLYLGPMTGPKVLAGKIQRGDVEELEAILWFSDIHGYSALSSQTDPQLLIQWLNEYYEAQIKTIHRYGGEVLKIMGDGMMAVFPTRHGRQMKTIARRALLAAQKSIQILQWTNEERHRLDQVPIEHGIALHHGRMQYGNIGSNDRLDFTVIGNDVNLTARISGLCGPLAEDVLLSRAMVDLLPGRTELLREAVSLKGIHHPQDIYRISRPDSNIQVIF